MARWDDDHDYGDEGDDDDHDYFGDDDALLWPWDQKTVFLRTITKK